MTHQVSQTDKGPNFKRRLVITGLLIAAAVLAFAYAMTVRDGKDAAGDASCPGARAKVAAMKPLVQGEIAALSVAAAPRPMPELTFAGADGSKTSLSHFRGRTVLFNLWATWCVPCRQEMPALDHLQEKLGSKDFAVVAVNIDTTRLDRPKAFLKEIGVNNLGFYSDSTAEAFQVLKSAGTALGLPTTVVVDANGCELGVMAGPAQWDSPEAVRLLAAAESQT